MAFIRMSQAIGRWARSSLERSKTTFAAPNACSVFHARTKWDPGLVAGRGPRRPHPHSRIRRRPRGRTLPSLRVPAVREPPREPGGNSGDARVFSRHCSGPRRTVARPGVFEGARPRGLRSPSKALRRGGRLCPVACRGADPSAGHDSHVDRPVRDRPPRHGGDRVSPGSRRLARTRRRLRGVPDPPARGVPHLAPPGSLAPGRPRVAPHPADPRRGGAPGGVVRADRWARWRGRPPRGLRDPLERIRCSYERALLDLGLWAVRLFPAVFGAVCVYRLVIEPQVLPSLEAWCSKQGIEIRTALPNVLTEWAAAKAENPPRSPS